MFLHVEPSSSFADIKKRIAANFNMDSSAIMLVANDKVSTEPKHSNQQLLYTLVIPTYRLVSLLLPSDYSTADADANCCWKYLYSSHSYCRNGN